MSESEREAIFEVFVAEAEEGCTAMETSLMALESRPDDAELVKTVFRTVHTIKGNAVSLGLDELADLAHALEDLLERLRAGALQVSSEIITVLLESVDALRRASSAAAAGRARGATTAPTPERLALLARVRALTQPGAETHGRDDAQAVAAPRPQRPRALRVGLDRLDRLLALAGEIAVARARVRSALDALPPAQRDALVPLHADSDRLYVELRELATHVRLVPVGSVFLPHLRTLRDVARRCGKQARLVVDGADVEVDAGVIEQIRDPIVHLVRNAVDHGIEAVPQRLARGKDPVGCVALRAHHDGGSMVVEVEDDGAGIDVEGVVRQAVRLGRVAEGQRLSTEDACRLVFEAGLSTAVRLTETSGRGVGMDVVRRNVEAVRGTVTVSTRPGCGTTFRLRVPLSVALVEGFAVGVAAQTFVIPLDAVVACTALPTSGERAAPGRLVEFRGAALPTVRLRDVFGLGGAPAWEVIVVVEHERQRMGLVVDGLVGEIQTVARPLGALLAGSRDVAGAALLADGAVGLIVDVAALLRRARGRSAAAGGAA